MVGGYIGKILRVNLTKKEIKTEPLNMDLAKQYIGGRGLGTKYYNDEVKNKKIDPFSEENKLIFATGPLTGTPAPSASRYMVITKGPLTNAIAASNSGGFWGPELKFAGFDMIIVEGKSDKPVYLWIHDGAAEFKDASRLWGKDTHETEDMILDELKDNRIKVAAIGPGGENLVKFASVINEKHRSAGRSGVGAVMGSKKLKAIAVRGRGKVTVSDNDKFKESLKEALNKIKTNSVTSEGLPKYGTAVLVNIINSQGLYPTFNFQEGVFQYANEMSGEAMAEKYLIKNKACFACSIACGRVTRLNGKDSEGPEYETLWAYSADCGVHDFVKVIEANYYADKLGLDTISTGATIAAAMELAEKGYIKKNEIDGPDLKFGNADAIVEYTKNIGYRKGMGNKLAEGSKRLAEMYGHPELSMAVKGQELPAYDPRGAYGHGLEYATSNRGGCHVRGYMISPEILGIPEKLDPLVTANKAQWNKTLQDLTAVIDSSGDCLFTVFALGAENYRDMINAVTGFGYTTEEMMKAGERVWNMERMLNIQIGFTKNDDVLPPRLVKEPMPEGPMKGNMVPLDKMLPEYYSVRGWSAEGVPTPAKLKDLNIS